MSDLIFGLVKNERSLYPDGTKVELHKYCPVKNKVLVKSCKNDNDRFWWEYCYNIMVKEKLTSASSLLIGFNDAVEAGFININEKSRSSIEQEIKSSKLMTVSEYEELLEESVNDIKPVRMKDSEVVLKNMTATLHYEKILEDAILCVSVAIQDNIIVGITHTICDPKNSQDKLIVTKEREYEIVAEIPKIIKQAKDLLGITKDT